MQKDQTIGAAIIAKNNDATIAATLQSIQRLCQQIVIVDTGSSDRTSEIALKYGAEIHYSLWNNSFAEARNHALEFLRTDWILIIDTDEILKSFNLPGSKKPACWLSLCRMMPPAPPLFLRHIISNPI